MEKTQMGDPSVVFVKIFNGSTSEVVSYISGSVIGEATMESKFSSKKIVMSMKAQRINFFLD